MPSPRRTTRAHAHRSPQYFHKHTPTHICHTGNVVHTRTDAITLAIPAAAAAAAAARSKQQQQQQQQQGASSSKEQGARSKQQQQQQQGASSSKEQAARSKQHSRTHLLASGPGDSRLQALIFLSPQCSGLGRGQSFSPRHLNKPVDGLVVRSFALNLGAQ